MMSTNLKDFWIPECWWSPILNYCINWASTIDYFIKFIDISIDLKYIWNRIYCRSVNIREVLIFSNFSKTNKQILESRENYDYECYENDNLQILDFVKSHKITNSRKYKHKKITRSTVYGLSSSGVNKVYQVDRTFVIVNIVSQYFSFIVNLKHNFQLQTTKEYFISFINSELKRFD